MKALGIKIETSPCAPRPYAGDPPTITYKRQPVSASQKRFKGRDELIPQIDLLQYRAASCIDWVKLRIYSLKPHQMHNIRRAANKALKSQGHPESAYVEGPEDLGAGQAWRCHLRLQAPSAASLAVVAASLRDWMGDNGETRPVFHVSAIEISVDFFVKNAAKISEKRNDYLRWQMVEVLRRHLRVMPSYTARPGAAPRFVHTVLSKRGKERRETTRVINPNVRQPVGLRSAAARLGLPKATSAIFHPPAHSQPVIDGTYYVGAKDDPVMVRIMNKETDERDNNAGTYIVLPNEQKRARIEVTLNFAHHEFGRGIEIDQIGEIDELFGYDFQGVRPKVFELFRPTIRRRGLRRDLGVPRPTTEIQAFTAGGVHSLHRLHEAEVEMLFAKRRLGLVPRQPEALGVTGYLLAYTDLNRMVDRSLKALSRTWEAEGEIWEEFDIVPPSR